MNDSVLLERPFIDLSEAIVKDRDSGVSCLQDREIEDLVRGKLSLDSEQFCQSHLLWCQVCQAKVEEETDFAAATRDALTLLQQERAEATDQKADWFKLSSERVARLFSMRFPMRWAVAVASVGVLLIVAGRGPMRRSVESEEIVLRSERGSAAPVEVESSASAGIRLRIDVSDVAPAPAFSLTIVDAAGRTLETRAASVVAGSVKLELRHKLTPGRYWVRLSAPDGLLLREYALSVRP